MPQGYHLYKRTSNSETSYTLVADATTERPLIIHDIVDLPADALSDRFLNTVIGQNFYQHALNWLSWQRDRERMLEGADAALQSTMHQGSGSGWCGSVNTQMTW